MNITVEDLMVERVMTATPSQTVEHIRKVMSENHVHALPVVDPDTAPLGIVTTSDLVRSRTDGAPVSSIMSRNVYTIPRYAGRCRRALPR